MIRRPKAKYVGLFLVLLLFMASGCKDDTYTACAKSTKVISDSVKLGIDTVQTLYTSASDLKIDRGERDGVLTILGNLTDANTQFRNDVRVLHTNPAATKADYLRVASVFVTNGQALLQSGALHVKNPAAQTKLSTVFSTIQTALDGVALAIQNAKGA